MNYYPPELHSYICSLACTDEGYTARSLTLVSRYFSQIALPYKYQSVCVSKPSQIHSLSTKLSKIPPHLRKIRHLFISDADNCGGSERDLVTSIISIITFAAPTLETLTFIASSPTTSTSLIARLFRTRFPHLHELTISGHYPFLSTPSCFPSLERLHLLGNRNPHGIMSLGGLESVIPNLTHLRMSELNVAVSFSQELQQAFNASSTTEGNDSSDCMFPAKLPPKLKRLVVQCGPGLSSSSKSARLKDEGMVKNFSSLEEQVGPGHTTRFFLLPRNTTDITSDILRIHWVDRLRGKEGCW